MHRNRTALLATLLGLALAGCDFTAACPPNTRYNHESRRCHVLDAGVDGGIDAQVPMPDAGIDAGGAPDAGDPEAGPPDAG